ncbi:Nucleoid-associated protein [Planctomycetes bacterium MalM25]|nr:Nucleoid-associated protein [Planctomycetes bacterium MalM25]
MFKGLGALGNIGQMMQQAQQVGAKMKEMQAELAAKRVTGEAGGGMVTVEMTGAQEVVKVTIDPGLVERGEREMIEDLTVAAIQDAGEKAKAVAAEAMQEATGGLDLPGMGDMLANLPGGQQ